MGSFCSQPSDVTSPKTPKERKASQSAAEKVKDEARKKKKVSDKELDKLIASSTSMANYSVLNTLGTGSYGAVKLAKHKQTDHMVAIKMTHKNHAAKGCTNTPHPVESAAWKQLQEVRSPFVVRTYCTFLAEPEICVVLELCEGGDVNVPLEMCGSFSAGDSKLYIAEICLGLAALHSQGIIYHDLKPQNMMLTKSGHIRLIDFGLASVKAVSTARNCCTCMSGAPSYMSP